MFDISKLFYKEKNFYEFYNGMVGYATSPRWYSNDYIKQGHWLIYAKSLEDAFIKAMEHKYNNLPFKTLYNVKFDGIMQQEVRNVLC